MYDKLKYVYSENFYDEQTLTSFSIQLRIESPSFLKTHTTFIIHINNTNVSTHENSFE